MNREELEMVATVAHLAVEFMHLDGSATCDEYEYYAQHAVWLLQAARRALNNAEGSPGLPDQDG